jgi:predicted N-acyltransferase
MTVDSIEKVEKEAWDALIDDNPFASHGWLKTVEETYIEDMSPLYILFKDSERLKGAATCYYQTKTFNIETLDDLLLGRLKKASSKLELSFLPALICCPLFCHGQHFLISKDVAPEEEEMIMRELYHAIEQMGNKKEVSIAFPNVMAHENTLITILKEKCFQRVTHMPLSYIDIKWSSFTEYIYYIKHLWRGANKAIKNEINRNKKEGVTISPMEDPKGYEGRLYELLRKHYYRYNQKPFMFKRPFIKKLKENLGKDVILYVSLKKGTITGVGVLLKRRKIAYALMLGIDHEMSGNDFTYFNIAYYRPIMDAISERMARLYFGIGMYRPKISRGCETKNVSFYYKPYHSLKRLPVKLWFAVFSSWMKYKLLKATR